MPTLLYAHMVRPEQSYELGPAAPQTYGLPIWLSAARTAAAPLPLPDTDGAEPPEDGSGAAFCRCSAFSLVLTLLTAFSASRFWPPRRSAVFLALLAALRASRPSLAARFWVEVRSDSSAAWLRSR